MALCEVGIYQISIFDRIELTLVDIKFIYILLLLKFLLNITSLLVM